MKKLILSAILLCSAVAAFACTNFIVGKKASADGSVICTYNCDSFGFLQPLDFSAPGRHAAGELIAIHGWGPQASERFITEAPYTYGVVGLMNDNPELKFEVQGHTDNTGNAAKNQTLSEQRAKAIVDKLVEMGISADRLSAVGKGQSSPLADNSTDEGRAKNRRVEFVKK